MDTITYWMGEPLAEVSREELESAFVDAHHEIARLNTQVRACSIGRVRDLAAIARDRLL